MLSVTAYCRSAIWGGSRLLTCFPHESPENLAEAWVFSLMPSKESQVKGEGLSDVLKRAGVSAETISVLPLVKLIDAKDMLSVQVHPNNQDALFLENAVQGKSEMWYILEADKNAFVYLGIKSTKAAFLSALDSRRPTEELQKVYVKKGDVLVIPAGMIHALGGGITLLEIQQPSDLTYRLWDYERRGENGQLRPLHLDKAKAVMKAFSKEEISAFQYAKGDEKSYFLSGDIDSNIENLANTPYFSLDLAHIGKGIPMQLSTPEKPLILLSLEGECIAKTNTEALPVCFGQVLVLLPADGQVTLSGPATVAIISI